jgi:hypothetical protein
MSAADPGPRVEAACAELRLLLARIQRLARAEGGLGPEARGRALRQTGRAILVAAARLWLALVDLELARLRRWRACPGRSKPDSAIERAWQRFEAEREREKALGRLKRAACRRRRRRFRRPGPDRESG